MNAITNAIVSLLTPLQVAGKVVQITGYAGDAVTGYPRIQVLSKGVRTEYLTNRERLAYYSYNIVITQEKTKDNITPETAEEVIELLVQEVIELLDEQINSSTPLSGTVDFIQTIETEEVEEIEELAVIRHSIILNAVKTV